ncbi:hypothetical protein [Lysobacter gummosus]|uniref:hypothetical protein n=1 Tax=Lysobacter gummosus TaxID=262324 RepID=UPI003639AF34
MQLVDRIDAAAGTDQLHPRQGGRVQAVDAGVSINRLSQPFYRFHRAMPVE